VNRGIFFLSTPEGITCTNWLERIGVHAYKVSSPDLVNHPDIAYIAHKKKPVILSTGMATLEEIRDAIRIVRNNGNREIILLHCTSCYPTNPDDVNLRALITLKKRFRLPVGFSDHTTGTLAAGIAVSLGACVIEKHFTLDRNLSGPDHQASLEPREFRAMVDTIRLTEKYLGSDEKKPVPAEMEMIQLSRKYLVAGRRIQKGQTISREDIAIKKTNNGIHFPTLNNIKKLVGTKVRKSYLVDDPL
jgi:N,N'-diacetyllegionaminate synthase